MTQTELNHAVRTVFRAYRGHDVAASEIAKARDVLARALAVLDGPSYAEYRTVVSCPNSFAETIWQDTRHTISECFSWQDDGVHPGPKYHAAAASVFSNAIADLESKEPVLRKEALGEP